MSTKNKSVQLSQLRVTDELFTRLLDVCNANGMSLADVRRAALAEYVQPTATLNIPIIGAIVPDDELGNKVVEYNEYVEVTEQGREFLEVLNSGKE